MQKPVSISQCILCFVAHKIIHLYDCSVLLRIIVLCVHLLNRKRMLIATVITPRMQLTLIISTLKIDPLTAYLWTNPVSKSRVILFNRAAFNTLNASFIIGFQGEEVEVIERGKLFDSVVLWAKDCRKTAQEPANLVHFRHFNWIPSSWDTFLISFAWFNGKCSTIGWLVPTNNSDSAALLRKSERIMQFKKKF